ncbi:MAG TPA: adenylate/guanylate cyclase domain-containing protein [Solirubrobacteraceae bacterium]|nr:adenylate/guanylate cyclase domain-containing protein [Solirubrobacteraceae bacterium]
MAVPETRFTKAGDLSIAYQVVGDGDVDVILVPQWLSNIEQYWEHPAAAYFLRRIAAFSRLIMFDKRGTGLSDPAPGTQTLEERMDDVLAVMDAAGSERAVLLGPSEGGPMAALFAATYPERCVSLILYGACARWLQAPDYPQGRPPELVKAGGQIWIDGWGSGKSLAVLAPSLARDGNFRQWWGKFERHSVRPGMVGPIFETINQIDVRAVLPAIRLPALIVHRRGDRLVDVANGRYLAANIPGARYVELDGEDHIYFAGDQDALLDEIEEFVTGSRGMHDPDHILATVMFTDIVRSTEHAARLGDRRWHDLMADHDQLMARQIAVYRGRTIRSTGDGVFAAFDGPARAIRCALAAVQAAHALDVDIRAGLHTGECQLAGNDLAGVTVHIGARIADLAEPSQVLVSGTVRDLVVGSNIAFQYRGVESLQGVPGEWRLFTVNGADRRNGSQTLGRDGAGGG